MKCDMSNPLKLKEKKQDIKVFQTLSSCESIQNAAKFYNDQDMLIKISGQDLIAKEFMKDPKCYKDESDMDQSQGSSVTNFSGFDEDYIWLRAKVKKRIEKEFAEQVIFSRVSYHQAEILISSAALCNTTVAHFTKGNKQFILKEAAKILRSDILTMIENAPELPWPPTPENLSNEDQHAPKSVGDFISQVIHATARLRSTTRRLENIGKLYAFNEAMQEQLQEGILEEVLTKPLGEQVHYTPHQPVIRDDAVFTKLRIIYDCSAKQNA